jgi:hypothetical protein
MTYDQAVAVVKLAMRHAYYVEVRYVEIPEGFEVGIGGSQLSAVRTDSFQAAIELLPARVSAR